MHLPEKRFGVPAFGVSVCEEGSVRPCAQGCGAVTGGCWYLMEFWFSPLPFAHGPFPLMRQLCARPRPPPEALRDPPGEVGAPGISLPLGPLLALDVRGPQSVSANCGGFRRPCQAICS